MDYDLHGKRKYKVSQGTTPSPTESDKDGNYFRNLAFSSSSSDHVPGKRTSSINFDSDRYNEHDDVFVISHADSSVFTQKNKDKTRRVESNRAPEENPTKTRTRKICYIIIFLVVILGLIAGVTVIVVFYIINLNQTTETTQSTVSPTTPQSNVVLESSVKLKNDWSNDLYNSSSEFYKTFSQNYTEEMDNLMQGTNNSQYYMGIKVLDFSSGSIIVHSEISFSPDIFTVFTDNIELYNSIEDVIIVESSLGKTSLLIDTSQVYVNGKCTPLDYSVCSSHYNSTSFPTFYGDKTYVAAVTYFQNNLQPIIDSSCSSVSSFFLCGLNFPSCYKARQLLPCRSVCEKYNTDCSSQFKPVDCTKLVDDPKLCLLLPPETTTSTTKSTVTMTTEQETTTEVKTTTPTTTETTTTMTTTPTTTETTTMTTTSTTTPSTTEATTTMTTTETTTAMTTDPPTTTTTQPTTTTPRKLECEVVQSDVCRQVGITKTMFPNPFTHNTQTEALVSFNSYINDSCSSNATLLYCNMFFPACQDDGRVQNPCKSLCFAAIKECGSALRLASEEKCNKNFMDTLCVSPLPPPTIPPVITTTLQPELCERVQYADCQQFSNYTLFPNIWNSTSHAKAVQVMMQFQGIIDNKCSSHTLHFFCSSTFLHCDLNTGVPKYPCKSLCEVVVKECSLPANSFPCQNLPDSNCIEIIQEKPNCTETGQETCPDGSCIMSEWLCDGESDCPDNWDEKHCTQCSGDQYRCLDGLCVDGAKRCNFSPDCPDQSDERDCGHLSEDVPGVFKVAYKNYHIPVCYDGWDQSYGPYTCAHVLGNKDYINSTGAVFYSTLYAHVAAPGDTGTFPSVIGNLMVKSTCRDNKVLSLQCQPKGCGQKLVGSGMIGYIVNGYQAAPGAWPWQAALELQVVSSTGLFRRHLCGGVLIKPRFVLTATHCVAAYQNKSLFRVILGATNRKTLGPSTKTYEVERVVNFDNSWYNFKKGDLTLLQLNETVVYTSYIQPICLPSTSQVTPTSAICYGTGWGQLSGERKGNFSDDLQELKLKLWKPDKCNSSNAWDGKIDDGYMCAGYQSGVRSMCSGDSGGPMVCKDNHNNWYLTGIASYVSNYCNMTNRPNVFTDVGYFLSWINNNTECIFTCNNGKCLYDKELLCNRVDNCGDNSDEITQCGISVNCTFEDEFLCGYQINGFKQHTPILESQSRKMLPAYDHTFGRYPGQYMAGNTPSAAEGRLTTPTFTVTGSSCLRFFYNLRGDLNAGLKVRLTPYSSTGNKLTSTSVWTSGEGVFTDKWRLGYFDLIIGTYDVIFIASDQMQVAIDDVALHDGLCALSACTNNEYRCSADTGSDTCISHSSLCDVVKDCHSDELNCNYEATNYMCRFENAALCGIQQETLDSGEWLLVNQTYLSTILYSDSYPDHTTGTEEGYFLFLMVNSLFQSRYVSMTMDVSLHGNNFCLSFWYRAVTEATFKVDIMNTTDTETLWKFTDRVTQDWTMAQIQLPPLGDTSIKFTVLRELPAVHSYIKPHLAIDDIHIKSGVCPQYVCPENWTKCGNEDFCFSPEQRCDRKIQCSDETDELNCDCKSSEFRCGNGRCIPLSQKCDVVPQCLDGSDEGSVCDVLKSVSCDFESPFLCGYSVQSNVSNSNEYKWLHHSGSTPSYYTGPNNDHTTGTVQGHYMYAEGNDGHTGDKAKMASIYFMTKENQSLSFFYHMFFKDLTKTGGLQVAVLAESTGTENIVWSQNMSTGESWTYGCIDLSANQNLSMIFIANHYINTSVQDADIAVDDVTLRDVPCGTDVQSDVTGETTTNPPTGCASNQFRCNNGLCISISDRCNGISDCINGEDEDDCS